MNASAYVIRFDKMEYIVCLVLSCLVFSFELFNTAIESTVDIVSPEFHSLAKVAKDCAAGAVLVSALVAVLTWSIITYSHLLKI